MKKRAAALFLLSAALAGCAAVPPRGADAPGQSAGPQAGSDEAYFLSLRAAILKEDKAWLAEQVFPALSVISPSGEETVVQKQDFLRRYDEIFTPAVRDAILRQDPSRLARDWKGVTAGSGALSFSRMAIVDEKTGREGPLRYYITAVGGVPAPVRPEPRPLF